MKNFNKRGNSTIVGFETNLKCAKIKVLYKKSAGSEANLLI